MLSAKAVLVAQESKTGQVVEHRIKVVAWISRYKNFGKWSVFCASLWNFMFFTRTQVKSLDELINASLIVILFLGTSGQLAKFEKYKNKWKDLEKELVISAVKKLNVEEVEIKRKISSRS